LAALKSAIGVSLGLVLIVLLSLPSACGDNAGQKASSARKASTSPKVTPSPSRLDPEVAMPDGFPADVPIYPGARLTAAAKFTSGSQTTWGMNWETFDNAEKAYAFYSARLNQGDWTFQLKGSNSTSFSATFSRRSNPKVSGILGVDSSSGIGKISLSLVS
jgi:hypothetical protein